MSEEADEMTEKERRQNADRLRFCFPPRTWRGRLFAWQLLLLWAVIAVVGGLEWTFLQAQLWEVERSDTAARLATLRELAAAGGIGLIVAAVGAAIASGWVLRPVRALLDAVHRVEQETFSTRVPVPPGEDELTALSRAFNRMMDRVEAAFERERRFTTDAAHELRTPLAAILGHVRLLRRWGKDDPRRLGDGLRAIETEAERLERLVGQLLALSRLERGLKEEVVGTCDGRAVLDAIVRDAAAAYPGPDRPGRGRRGRHAGGHPVGRV